MAKPVYALVNGVWTLVGSTTAHNHTVADVTGLQVAIDAKANLASPTFTGTLTADTVKITGGVPGIGKVLTSDADGDATWADAATNNSLPTGGTTGQVLAKTSATNYDVAWVEAAGGGGEVIFSRVGATSLMSATGTSEVVVPMPSGASTGNTIVAYIATRNGTGTRTCTATGVSSFTKVSEDTSAIGWGLFIGVITGAVPTTVTLGAGAIGTDNIFGAVVVYQGADALVLTPSEGYKTDFAGGWFGNSSTSFTAPAWTVAGECDAVQFITAGRAYQLTEADPNWDTLVAGITGGQHSGMVVADRLFSASTTPTLPMTSASGFDNYVRSFRVGVAPLNPTGEVLVPVGGTTGQVLAKAGNDNGNVGWVAPTNPGIQQTLFDAKGDILVASGADTAARLPAGTNGQILLADSAEATGLKWVDSSVITPSYSTDLGAITGGVPVTVTHNLNTYDVVVQILEKNTAGAGGAAGVVTDATVAITSANAVDITFVGAAVANLYRVTVVAVGGNTGSTGWTQYDCGIGGLVTSAGTIGNGVFDRQHYQVEGTMCHVDIKFTFGSTTTVAGPDFIYFNAPPIIPHAHLAGVGQAHIYDDSTTNMYRARAWVNTIYAPTSYYITIGRDNSESLNLFSSTAPMTWAVNDSISVFYSYRIVQ